MALWDKNILKGQLKPEWIYEVSIFQNSNENIVKDFCPDIFIDSILMFTITYIKRKWWKIYLIFSRWENIRRKNLKHDGLYNSYSYAPLAFAFTS